MKKFATTGPAGKGREDASRESQNFHGDIYIEWSFFISCEFLDGKNMSISIILNDIMFF